MNKLIIILIIIIVIICRIINKKHKINIFKLSNRKIIKKIDNNVYIVDNFYENPYAIRDYALRNKNNFKLHSALYNTQYYNPFLYANNSKEIINFFERISGEEICDKIWNVDLIKESNGFIQYITEKSNPVVHKDLHWGVVVYLTPNADISTGTSLYTHKETGIKHVMECLDTKTNKPKDICKLVKRDLWKEGEKNRIDYWKIRHRIDNIFNRAIIFDGRNFHASNGGFGTNIENGRLFQTFFFSPQKKLI